MSTNQFSIIIPTYNRAEQLVFTLSAFSCQEIELNRFEVIVVDDCSTDYTRDLVSALQVPYRLVYERLDSRRWQGAARNRGVQLAQFSNIIFCDTDMLVLADFLASFDKMITDDCLQVVTATPNCFQKIYTNYYSEFSPNQARDMIRTLNMGGIDCNDITEQSLSGPILSVSELLETPLQIRRLVSDHEVVPQELKFEFYSQDVAPWLLFISRCVSLKRTLFIESGGFDSSIFRGEDWELDYRLAILGARFEILDNVVCYHQEHPLDRFASTCRPFNEVMIQKHGLVDPELILLVPFESSDSLWMSLPAYKNLVRMLRDVTSPSHRPEFELLCKLAAMATMNWNNQR